MIIPSNTSGGAERVMSQLANHFAIKGIKVKLVNFDKGSNFYKIDDSVDYIKLNLQFKSTSKLKNYRSSKNRNKEIYCYKTYNKRFSTGHSIAFSRNG